MTKFVEDANQYLLLNSSKVVEAFHVYGYNL